jgi:hypothetical protein
LGSTDVTTNLIFFPPGGGGKRVVGRMDEVDLGEVTRPKKNATSELSHIPD